MCDPKKIIRYRIEQLRIQPITKIWSVFGWCDNLMSQIDAPYRPWIKALGPLEPVLFLRKLYNLYSDNLNQMCLQKRHVFVLHIFSLCIFFERSTEACLGNYNIDLSDLLLVITSSDYSPARPQLDGLELIGSRLHFCIAVTLSMGWCFGPLELSQKHFNYFFIIWAVL